MKKLALVLALTFGTGSAMAVPLVHKHHKASKKSHKVKKDLKK